MDDSRPIFLQIAEQIENDIIEAVLPEESQAPSTNEIAAFYRINPATAGKGLNRLVDKGILYKKRGIGMFVAAGARQALIAERSSGFADEFIRPLLREARKLGITGDQLVTLIRAEDASAATGVAGGQAGSTGAPGGDAASAAAPATQARTGREGDRR